MYKIDCVDEEVVDMKHIPLKVVKKISVIFSVLGLLLVIIGICLGTTTGLVLWLTGVVILVGVIIFTILFRRCPYCGEFLKVGFQNFYCPHCGNYIDGNKYKLLFFLLLAL